MQNYSKQFISPTAAGLFFSDGQIAHAKRSVLHFGVPVLRFEFGIFIARMHYAVNMHMGLNDKEQHTMFSIETHKTLLCYTYKKSTVILT